jgi:HEAT repeat protein
VREARERLERTLSAECLREWLKRLEDEDPRVRAATAKGLWKLRSTAAFDALLQALEKETDVDAKAALGINALACAGEMNLTGRQQERMWRVVWPRLRRLELEDPREREALANLFRAFRFGSSRGTQAQLEGLRRFWAE